MSSLHHNLSVTGLLPDASSMSFAIVVSEWNSDVTEALYKGCLDTLILAGCSKEKISRFNVPGSFELPLGAKYAMNKSKADAVICIGCVIQGETRHFDFICDAVSNGIMNLGLESGIPVIFGVLTPQNQQQALDRAGGKHGNKGVEAAATAIKMIDLKRL
ncbi:MAG: 6,7-dimethyl-8-ribityllumazine synthase [Bacteroidia bacterium]